MSTRKSTRGRVGGMKVEVKWKSAGVMGWTDSQRINSGRRGYYKGSLMQVPPSSVGSPYDRSWTAQKKGGIYEALGMVKKGKKE